MNMNREMHTIGAWERARETAAGSPQGEMSGGERVKVREKIFSDRINESIINHPGNVGRHERSR